MDLSRNIQIASVRSFFSMFLIVVPVLVPYWQSLGLSIQQVLEIQAIFGLAVAVLEVPTGYIADLWGRKVSVVVGSFISACGFSLLPFATTYWGLVVFEVVVALGSSLVSGALDAIVYESIPEGASRKQVIGAFNGWPLLGEVISSLVAGVLVLYSFSAVVWGQVIVGWVPFFVSLFFVEPPRHAMSQTPHTRRLSEVFRRVLVDDPLTRLVFINYVIWGLSGFCVVWLLQRYWLEAGVHLSYFGLLWAGLMLVSVVVSRRAHLIEARLGAHWTLILIGICPILGYALMVGAPMWVGIIAGGLFYVTRGLTYVVYQDAFNWRVPSVYRATANSMQSLFFRLGFGVIGPVIGYIIDAQGLRVGLFVLGVLFTIFAGTLLVPLTRRIDQLHVEYIPES